MTGDYRRNQPEGIENAPGGAVGQVTAAAAPTTVVSLLSVSR